MVNIAKACLRDYYSMHKKLNICNRRIKELGNDLKSRLSDEDREVLTNRLLNFQNKATRFKYFIEYTDKLLANIDDRDAILSILVNRNKNIYWYARTRGISRMSAYRLIDAKVSNAIKKVS